MSNNRDLIDMEVGGEDSPIDFFADDNLEIEVPKPKPEPSAAEAAAAALEAEAEKGKTPEELAAEAAAKKLAEEAAAEEDVTFFGVDNEEEEEDEEGNKIPKVDATDEDEEDEPVNTDTSISSLAYLKEKGLVEYELEEGEEMTQERAEELLEDSYELSIENAIKEKFADLPEPIKQLNKFVLNGGNPAEFFAKLATDSTSRLQKGMDVTTEAVQETVMRETLKAEGYDKDYIDTQLDFLKDSKKLETVAKAKYSKWEEKSIKEEEALVARQATAKVNEKNKIRESKKAVSTLFNETNVINDIVFDKKDVKEIPSYMYDKQYKMDNGREITEMEKDLMDAMQDKNKFAVLAKMLRSDFDLKSFKTEASTEATKQIRKNLSRTSGKVAGEARKKQNVKKNLADYFD